MPQFTKDRVFVSVQVLLLLMYVFDLPLWRFVVSASMRYTGLLLFFVAVLLMFFSLLQLNKNLTPFPSPKKDATLVTTGVYKYIRHPIYTAIVGITIGYALFSGSGFRLLIAGGLCLLFNFKAAYEERLLQAKFAGYAAYKKKAGKFLPKLFH